jgi:F0F1-type ATP synthase membrane subunit b/b'
MESWLILGALILVGLLIWFKLDAIQTILQKR